MSCDEAVMRQMGTDLRAAYSASLLNLASGKRFLRGRRLALARAGEEPHQEYYAVSKTAVFVAVPGFVLVGIVLVALASNPARDSAVSADGNQNEEESRDSWGTHINEKPRGGGLASGKRCGRAEAERSFAGVVWRGRSRGQRRKNDGVPVVVTAPDGV